MYNMDLLNGNHPGNQPAFPGQAYGAGNKNNITLEQVDPSTFGDDDSDEDEFHSRGIKPGKKTKGRVKIKMEFIENKLRRYTTFSKRKTGIMKKFNPLPDDKILDWSELKQSADDNFEFDAYELSTLTGTQVMLLVASETGHVYTFATRKLQPMITSESGKALIQTCLNSPDPPPIAPGQQQAVEQRMNPGGFEETELTYAVDDETGKMPAMDGSNGSYKPTYTLCNVSSSSSESLGVVQAQQSAHQPQPYQNTGAPQSSAVSVATVVQQPMTVVNSSQSPNTSKSTPTGGISLQLPVSYPGFIIQPGNAFTIPVQSSPQGNQISTSQTQQVQPQTVYRIPTQAGTHLIQSDTGQRPQSNSAINSTAQTTVLSAANQQATPALTPSVYMYQTPQGIVYAPATGAIQEKTIFNFQQPATALSVSQDTGGQQQGQPQSQQQQQQQQQQQIITIPVPVSLAGSPQILQLATDAQPVPDLSQPSVAKKPRK